MFALSYAVAVSLSWWMHVLNGAIQVGGRWEAWMVSMSPALTLWDCNKLWSGDLNRLIRQEALWIWGCSGWSGGRDSSRSVALKECLSIENMIGNRSACTSNKSVAVDHIAPVMWRAAVCWTLANLFEKPTYPVAFLLLVWLTFSQIGRASCRERVSPYV